MSTCTLTVALLYFYYTLTVALDALLSRFPHGWITDNSVQNNLTAGLINLGSFQMGILHDHYHALAALFLGVYALVYLYGLYRRRKTENQFAAQHGCQPPIFWNSRWPLGLDMLLKLKRYIGAHRALHYFLDLNDQCGTTYEQRLFGTRAINTIEPENLAAVLSSNFTDYSHGLREMAFHPLLGSGIFTQDGQAWKQSRELIRPYFGSPRQKVYEHIQSCVERLIDSLPQNGTVDLQPKFFDMTFQTTLYNLFGDDIYHDQTDSSFVSAFYIGQDYILRRAFLSRFYWMLNTSEFRQACRQSHYFVDKTVNEVLQKFDESGIQEKSIGRSFLWSMLQRTRDRRVLRDQCLNVLLAGRDTTACCLSWTIRLLCQHEHVLNRVRHEIFETCGLGPNAQPPSRKALRDMIYLSQVIREVLRLYPPVPVNSRTATKLTTLPIGGGLDGRSPILVRPGEAVRFSVYGLHRRKDIYGPDADEFRPERWAERELENVGWGYLPFHGGPRTCIGQDFALLEIAYTVARLIQVFPSMRAAEGCMREQVGTERQTLSIVVSSYDGCKVSLPISEDVFRSEIITDDGA